MNAVVITGGSSGIGEALAREFAKKGYPVVIGARSGNKIEKISQDIIASGGSCLAVKTDISNPESVLTLYNKASSFGKISIVISNAGLGYFNKLDEMTVESWDDQLNVNLRGAFLLCKAFVPSMKNRLNGTLVFINSIAGLNVFANSTAYCASKFGLRGLAGSLREELRDYNIKVMSVFPGAVNTNFWENINIDFKREDMLDSNSVARNIISNVEAPGNLVVEDLVLRRTAGDF